MEKILRIDNLCKKYKNGRGVADISFSVEEGEIVGLLGPNGSGKTTIMKTIVGLRRYDSGSISVFGSDPADNSERTLKDVGALIEQPALYDSMSPRRQMRMMARFYPSLPAGAIENALREVGLEAFGDEKVQRFSLGMKQRLGIALALFSDPKLVILDEPGNGLDIESSVALRRRIVEMAKEDGKTFLVSSHQADEIEKMCDRVIIIYEGALIEDISTEDALRLSPTLEDYFLMRVREAKGGVS
ncbi:MAG: ABC transporter ATP-binding protein [Bacillota bacterium]|jgi:ABC-2 type transport system ATP-binding protein